MSQADEPRPAPVLVGPEDGRRYDMGRMRAVFFSDGEETAGRYSISEWWLDPRSEGPPEHAHPEDHIYRVLTGTLSVRIDGRWTDAPRGTYAFIPGETPHAFENRADDECGFISINVPGGFEDMMPHLVKWFAERPLGDVAADSDGNGP